MPAGVAGCYRGKKCPHFFAPLTPRDLRHLREMRDAASLPHKLITVLRRHHTRILDLFLAWDQDHNGCISRAELERALKCLGIQASRGDIDDFMAGLDLDDTGGISFRALHHALLNTEPKIAIKTKVKERRAQLESEKQASGRQAALQVLLEHEQTERARVEARNAELEEELERMHRQLSEVTRQRDQLRKEQRTSPRSGGAAPPPLAAPPLAAPRARTAAAPAVTFSSAIRSDTRELAAPQPRQVAELGAPLDISDK